MNKRKSLSAFRGSLWNRRDFMNVSAGAAFAVAVPIGWRAHRRLPHGIDPASPMVLRDPRVKALALSALDAAQSVGAHYADVRLTYNTSLLEDSLVIGMDVRALVEGYWGSASRPDLCEEAGPWLGREAVRLAKASVTSGLPREVDLGTIPLVHDGVWTTPIQIDPFEVDPEERKDWEAACAGYIQGLGVSRGDKVCSAEVNFGGSKEEGVFASTEGSYLAQTCYIADPQLTINYRGVRRDCGPRPAKAGWEYLIDVPIGDVVRQEMDRIDVELAEAPLPLRPFEIGRYDVIFPAQVVAQMLNETIGHATQLERVVGYEANGSGTSYLGPDPLAVLGTPVASPLVTVTAERSAPRALATVQWDDEGVVPEPFTIVQDGMLVDFQTTREQAAWLAPWYHRQGKPIRSHGCAVAGAQQQPNLTLHPGREDLAFEDLVKGVEHGLILDVVDWRNDFQKSTNWVRKEENGRMIEVRRGKRVAQLQGKPCLTFQSLEAWKKVIAVGGPQSVERGFKGWSGIEGYELDGDGYGTTAYSIAAVPVVMKELALIDFGRMAS